MAMECHPRYSVRAVFARSGNADVTCSVEHDQERTPIAKSQFACRLTLVSARTCKKELKHIFTAKYYGLAVCFRDLVILLISPGK